MKNVITIAILMSTAALAQPVQTVVQQPDCLIPFRFSAVGTVQLDNRFQGCVNWTIACPSGCTVTATLSNAAMSPGAIIVTATTAGQQLNLDTFKWQTVGATR